MMVSFKPSFMPVEVKLKEYTCKLGVDRGIIPTTNSDSVNAKIPYMHRQRRITAGTNELWGGLSLVRPVHYRRAII